MRKLETFVSKKLLRRMNRVCPSSHKLNLYIDVFCVAVACFSLALEFVSSEVGSNLYFAWVIQHRFVLSIIFTLEYAYLIGRATRVFAYVLSFEGLTDLMTSIPVLFIELFPAPGLQENLHVSLLALRILKLKRAQSHIRGISEKKAFATFRFILSLIYISAAAISIVEQISFIRSFYFLVMSITTVGYGDVSLVSAHARVLVVVLILWTWIYIPMTTQRVVNTFDQKSVYQLQRFVSSKSKNDKHIVVCEIGAHELVVLLGALIQDQSDATQRRLVLLNNEPPSTAISLFLSDPKYAPYLTYIEGSALSAKDLARAGLREASACFIFAGDTQKLEKAAAKLKDAEDYAFFSLFSVLDYRKFRNQDITNFVVFKVSLSERARAFRSVLRSSFPEYIGSSKPIGSILCTDDIRLRMAANSCQCPGFTTFVTNLLMPIDTTEVASGPPESLPDWLLEYLDGSKNRIFAVTLSDIFQNVVFSEASRIIHEVTGMLLFAVAIESKNGNGVKRCLINPAELKFPMTETLNVTGYVLAKTQADAHLLEDEKLGSKKGAAASFNVNAKSLNGVGKNRELLRGKLQVRLIKGVKRKRHSMMLKEASSVTARKESGRTEFEQHIFNILRIDGQHALEWFAFSPVKRSISEATIQTALVKNFPKIRNHVVLLSSQFELTEFILPLRCKAQAKHFPIVILCNRLPNELEWTRLSYFTDIYLFCGSSNDIQALKSCGIRYASTVVILRDRASATTGPCSAQYRKKSLDTLNLLSYYSVYSINPAMHMICEVTKQESIALLQKRLVANDTNTTYNNNTSFNAWNVFAAGNIYYSHLTSALSAQYHKNPELRGILSRLVHGIDFEKINSWNGAVRTELLLSFKESGVFEVRLKNCERRPYGYFVCGLSKVGILPFAVRRGVLEKLKFGMKGNKMPFVLTNPDASTSLYGVDSLLCFAPEDPITLIFGAKDGAVEEELKTMIEKEPKVHNSDVLQSLSDLKKSRRNLLMRRSGRFDSEMTLSSLVDDEPTKEVQEMIRKHSSVVMNQLGDLQSRLSKHYSPQPQ